MARPPIDPNVITTLRLPLAPIAVAFLITGTVWGTITAMVITLILELTDFLDGFIARKYGVVTDFGKLYDPFSDAFCRYTLFLGLFAVDALYDSVRVMDLWMIIAIFYRDSSISFFRSIAASRRSVVGARVSGKIKAWVQGVGTQVVFLFLVLAMFFPDNDVIAAVPWWTMLIVTLATLGSFVDYFIGYLPILRDAWRDRPTAE